ncbi:hypothetical protein GYMLUDRAFT_216158, partial [Collybiopsis luxurians FD-317 M1]
MNATSPSLGHHRVLRSMKGRPNIQSTNHHAATQKTSSSPNTSSSRNSIGIYPLGPVVEEPLPSTSHAILSGSSFLAPQAFSTPSAKENRERKKKRKDKYDRPLPPTPPPSESILSPESGFELVVSNDNESFSSSSPTITSGSSAVYIDKPAKKKYHPEMVYSHLHKLAEREISKAVERSPDIDTSILQTSSEIQAGAVFGVVHSRKYRDRVSQMLSGLTGPEIPLETKIYEAITKDEPQVANLFRSILKSEEEEAAALALKGQDAELFMDALEDVISFLFYILKSSIVIANTSGNEQLHGV